MTPCRPRPRARIEAISRRPRRSSLQGCRERLPQGFHQGAVRGREGCARSGDQDQHTRRLLRRSQRSGQYVAVNAGHRLEQPSVCAAHFHLRRIRFPLQPSLMPPNGPSGVIAGGSDPFTAVNNGAQATAAFSHHPGGVNLVLADGSVRFIKNHVDIQTWWALAASPAVNSSSTNSEIPTLPAVAGQGFSVQARCSARSSPVEAAPAEEATIRNRDQRRPRGRRRWLGRHLASWRPDDLEVHIARREFPLCWSTEFWCRQAILAFGDTTDRSKEEEERKCGRRQSVVNDLPSSATVKMLCRTTRAFQGPNRGKQSTSGSAAEALMGPMFMQESITEPNTGRIGMALHHHFADLRRSFRRIHRQACAPTSCGAKTAKPPARTSNNSPSAS